MNTPSHAIVNLALLMNGRSEAVLPIIVGAVLPDVPMFVMYFWAKRVLRQSEAQVWSETYWKPHWQWAVHLFHSIPLAAIATFLFHLIGWQWLELICLSAILHSLGDLPLHNHDAHRHFLPFSRYRLISPISYWDPRHYGRLIAWVEKGLVLALSIYLFPIVNSWVIRLLLVAFNLSYLTGHFYRWVFQDCLRTQAETQSS
jgi:hypothetical protein